MKDLIVTKSEGWYVAEVPSLHIVTRAKTLKSLKMNLKEATEVALDGLLEIRKAQLSRTSVEKAVA